MTTYNYSHLLDVPIFLSWQNCQFFREIAGWSVLLGWLGQSCPVPSWASCQATWRGGMWWENVSVAWPRQSHSPPHCFLLKSDWIHRQVENGMSRSLQQGFSTPAVSSCTSKVMGPAVGVPVVGRSGSEVVATGRHLPGGWCPIGSCRVSRWCVLFTTFILGLRRRPRALCRKRAGPERLGREGKAFSPCGE